MGNDFISSSSSSLELFFYRKSGNADVTKSLAINNYPSWESCAGWKPYVCFVNNDIALHRRRHLDLLVCVIIVTEINIVCLLCK